MALIHVVHPRCISFCWKEPLEYFASLLIVLPLLPPSFWLWLHALLLNRTCLHLRSLLHLQSLRRNLIKIPIRSPNDSTAPPTAPVDQPSEMCDTSKTKASSSCQQLVATIPKTAYTDFVLSDLLSSPRRWALLASVQHRWLFAVVFLNPFLLLVSSLYSSLLMMTWVLYLTFYFIINLDFVLHLGATVASEVHQMNFIFRMELGHRP